MNVSVPERWQNQRLDEPPVVKHSNQRKGILGSLIVLGVLLVISQIIYVYYKHTDHARTSYIEQVIEEADFALAEGNKERASTLYQQIVEEDIEDITLLREVEKLELKLYQEVDPQATALPPADDLAQLLNEANMAYVAKDWPKTIELYEKLRAQNVSYQEAKVKPELLQAYINQALYDLALGREQGGNLDLAATYFQKALRLSPSEPTVSAENQYLNDFLSAERALRDNTPEQALALLQPLYEQPHQYLREDVTNLLFRTYLVLGDQAIRSNQASEGAEYYQQANQLNGPDKTNLQRRLDGIGLLFAATPTAVTESVAVAAPVAPVQQAVSPPTSTPLPTAIPTSAPVCADSHSVLREPGDNAVLSGVVTFTGTAMHDALQYYKLEYAPWGTPVFAYFTGGEQSVENGALGTLDTRALANGHYAIRLMVVDRDGNYPPPCEVHIIISN
ncbi:MAG: hypothetical protein KDE54_08275 [Caldilineaceae bacterium]|nr:hypothetical protein [Caldilineaceae bacterium]MCB0096471.1 hypothetical protein [Caldilineaceae bacterium]